ncbi:TetR/AcrR family transcriptional regulator [Candidatus Chloroploca sp. Khr17]|uniref:TetR/AcrR family transcriptional regulator n=1 Tax=Candidatus Chloroploca sp. Khr17 TaxID=2496869 RepID=UPI00101D8D5A|nr:TetR/AcrR family transcriptional regulator [Candidatus Chloroploca sp. Khr17]
MARTVNEQEYAEKRAEIIAVARRLVYSKGYEHMVIKDILDELQISKGAFYHYFSSKQDLLEGLLDQLLTETEQIMAQIINRTDLSESTKLKYFFDTIGRWKTDQKAMFLSILRVWHADNNAIVRQKMMARSIQHLTPFLARLIEPGVRDGTLNTPFPDYAGAIALTLMQGLNAPLVEMLLSDEPNDLLWPQARRLIDAYNDAIERVLGAEPGHLQLIDVETLHEWFTIT